MYLKVITSKYTPNVSVTKAVVVLAIYRIKIIDVYIRLC